jgi:hypothetical protein
MDLRIHVSARVKMVCPRIIARVIAPTTDRNALRVNADFMSLSFSVPFVGAPDVEDKPAHYHSVGRMKCRLLDVQ